MFHSIIPNSEELNWTVRTDISNQITKWTPSDEMIIPRQRSIKILDHPFAAIIVVYMHNI